MIAVMVVAGDEGFDLLHQIIRQKVIFKQDAVLQDPMPSLDLTLRLWMVGCTTNMIHATVTEPLASFPRYVTGTIV